MKIVQDELGRFSKDGVNYRIKREEGDTQRPRQYAEENGYAVRGPNEVRLSIAKVAKKRTIAKARYAQEMGGFDLPAEQGGLFIPTDPRTRTLLNAAVLRATIDSSYEVPNWKLITGEFITLSNEQVIVINEAVYQFITACFAKEAALCAEVNASVSEDSVALITW